MCLKRLSALLLAGPILSFGQPADSADFVQERGRIFWVIPNYRTAPSLIDYEPLTRAEKFNLATRDSFDPGTVALGAFFAGQGQLTHSAPSFGHGATGYTRYFAASYADFAIGDLLTGAIYPALLHQDPRYFQRGTGSGWSRLGYAMGQVFLTHSDSGRTQFNYSELAGNATAVAISNVYYPDSRTAGSAAGRLTMQIGVDAACNVLKEFWPDIERRFFRKRHSRASSDPPTDDRGSATATEARP
jgi:hypothetical protein